MASPAVRYLLGHLLELVPEFTPLEPFRDLSLNTWRVSGAYSFVSSTSNSFILDVNPREYARTIFAEAQHLLNQASEHRAHIVHFQNAPNEPSPSWLFVSLYYFSLYIAMAWTRVANSGVIYLDKDSINQYCAGAPKLPHAGAFRTTIKPDESIGQYRVEIRKCNSGHFHEAVWSTAINETTLATKWIESLSKNRKPTSEEMISLRALRLFSGLGFDDSFVWPSKLRNAINYRPGFSYRTVVSHNFLRINSRLSQKPFQNVDALLTYGEKAKSALKRVAHPADEANDSIDLLIAQSLILEDLVESALLEICQIRELKSSAHQLRKKFKKVHCATESILTQSALMSDC